MKRAADKLAENSINAELQGSWTVVVGDQDQCVHLWKYAGGYGAIDTANNLFSKDEVSFSLMDNCIMPCYIVTCKQLTTENGLKVKYDTCSYSVLS